VITGLIYLTEKIIMNAFSVTMICGIEKITFRIEVDLILVNNLK